MKKALKVLKALGFMLIGFIVGIIAAAPSGDESTETVKKVTETTAQTQSTAQTETKSNEQAAKPVEKAPVPVFEDDRIKISFVKLDANGVKFLAENKTNISITIQADSIAVNGFSSNDITMSDDVAPNSKGFVTVKTSELRDVGSPEKVSGKLRIIDFNDSFESYAASFTDVVVK